jgi:TrpR-related protein YerC/YecD
MDKILNDKNTELFFESILQLESVEECRNFFEDLCTVNELKSISQRIVVAKMLRDKKVYSEIVDETGASTATVSRVNRSLQYGCGGYDLVFERMNGESDK